VAKGYYYHKYNALKFRILQAMIEIDKPVTAQMVADHIGIDRNRVSIWFCRAIKYKYRYIRRLDKKAKGGNHKALRYSINPYGRLAYKIYDNRMKKGLTLNCKRKFDMRKARGYIGIGEKGLTEGISREMAFNMAGLEAPDRYRQISTSS
jgi:hypothetical protein